MKIRLSLDIDDAEEFIDRVILKYHFESTDRKQLLNIYRQLQLVLAPYAEYRINTYSTGVELIDRGTATAVAMSLGEGIDKLQDRFMREEKLSEAYMLDCLAAELLLIMYREFNAAYARFHRRYVERYVFVGDRIPADAIPEILRNIHGADRIPREAEEPLEHRDEVTANEYGVLSPSKSVVFYAVLSENPAVKCQGICMGCGRADCENRFDVLRQLPEGAGDRDSRDEKQNNIVELNYGYQRIFGNKKLYTDK